MDKPLIVFTPAFEEWNHLKKHEPKYKFIKDKIVLDERTEKDKEDE